MKEKKKLGLPAWIFIGMLAGIVAGLIFAFAGLGDFTTEWIKPIGTIYVNLLKFLVVPVVLFSIADGVISLKDLKRVGSVGVKTFVYYMCTTALAVVIGLILVNIFKLQRDFVILDCLVRGVLLVVDCSSGKTRLCTKNRV